MDRVAPAFGAGRSFFFTCDPRAGGEDRVEVARLFSVMSEQEKLPGFDPEQPGAFSVRYTGKYYDEDLQKVLPTGSEGYPKRMGRPRENMTPLDILFMNIRPSNVRRRSVRFHDAVIDEVLVQAESNLNHDYACQAMQFLRIKRPFLFEKPSQENCLKLLLASQFLNQARMVAILRAASSWMLLTPMGVTTWKVKFDAKLTSAMQFVYSVTVGEWAVLEHAGTKVNFLVHGVGDDFLMLKLGLDNFERPAWLNFTVRTFVRFERNMQWRLPLTASIDALVCMKDVFLPTRKPGPSGKAMINQGQLELLKKGLGFENLQLDRYQKEAVIKILSHECAKTVQTITGPAGTGKTTVIEEVILQFIFHHKGLIRQDALVHVALPTNDGCRAMAKRLIEKGVPAELIVRLVSDHELRRDMDTNYRTERVVDIKFDAKVQIYIATPLVLARICMSKHDKLYFNPPKIVIIDDICSLTASEALAPCTMNGEPESILIAGDASQIKPTCPSQTAEMLAGTVTLVDILKLSNWYFKSKTNCYPNPDPLVGIRFLICYRARSDLVKLLSDLAYGGKLQAPKENWKIDDEANCLVEILNNQGVFRQACKGSLMWVNHSSPFEMEKKTQSFINPLEIEAVVELVNRMTKAIDGNKILVVSPYRAHSLKLKEMINSTTGTLVRHVDDIRDLERPVVVISMVRSEFGTADSGKPMGCFEPFLMNTMLGRAKMLAVVVGSYDFYKDSGITYWTALTDQSEVVEVENIYPLAPAEKSQPHLL